MIERTPQLIDEEALFADLDERIATLKQRDEVRPEILRYIDQGDWDKALGRAGEVGIQLFEDPYFSKQATEYWERVTQETSRLKDAAAAAIAEAETAQRKAEGAWREAKTAIQKMRTAMRQDAMYTALFRADQALLHLDTDELQRQLEIIERTQADDISLPEVRRRQGELQADLDWLREEGVSVTDGAIQLAKVAELAGRRSDDSRLATLWQQQQNAANAGINQYIKQKYVQALAKLAQQLKEGQVNPFLETLGAQYQAIVQDKELDAFQRVVLLDVLAMWRRRIEKWQALAVVANKAEQVATVEIPDSVEQQRILRTALIRQKEQLQTYLYNTPSEVFACNSGVQGITIAERWQTVFAKLVERQFVVDRHISGRKMLRKNEQKWQRYKKQVEDGSSKCQRKAEHQQKVGSAFFRVVSTTVDQLIDENKQTAQIATTVSPALSQSPGPKTERELTMDQEKTDTTPQGAESSQANDDSQHKHPSMLPAADQAGFLPPSNPIQSSVPPLTSPEEQILGELKLEPETLELQAPAQKEITVSLYDADGKSYRTPTTVKLIANAGELRDPTGRVARASSIEITVTREKTVTYSIDQNSSRDRAQIQAFVKANDTSQKQAVCTVRLRQPDWNDHPW